MKELSIEKLKNIEGGASSTTTINAIVKAISTLFTLGQALGNVILKIFKAQVAKDGTLTAARARQEYKKPGVKRREEKKKNTQNCHKNNRRYAS